MVKYLTTRAAPAAKAVEYNKVKFNNTMGEGSPYVGSGPEVDKAWHAISYDSKRNSLGNRKSETNSLQLVTKSLPTKNWT
jgi:hypothetical protein